MDAGAAPPPADPGSVRYIHEIWLDPARQRHVNVRIALPPLGSPRLGSPQRSGGAMPVLLFTAPQGFRWDGHADQYEPLAEELMRRGVVMVTVTHYDLAEPMGPGERFQDIYPGILTGSRNDPAVDRFEDCLFVLATLARINSERRDAWPRLDMDRLAVAGHSSGTLTALHLSGLPVRDRDGGVFAVHRDARIKAFVIYSYSLDYSGPSRADLMQVGAVPGLQVAGSDDHPEYRNTPYRFIHAAPQYWLVAKGNHNVGAGGSDELILQATGDFVDAYLSNNVNNKNAALARLDTKTLEAFGSDFREFASKPASRWPQPDRRDVAAWAVDFLPWGEWLHARTIARYRALQASESKAAAK